jgi:hypothetical protein
MSSSGTTLNLPNVSHVRGIVYHIKNTASSGNVTIDPLGAQTIDGSSTLVLGPGDKVTIVCTGNHWLTI